MEDTVNSTIQSIVNRFRCFENDNTPVCVIDDLEYCDTSFTIRRNQPNFILIYSNHIGEFNYTFKNETKLVAFLNGTFR
tara:strand:+ start:518 stop:754 length:237 start_codon:yes stop_codon:yes gene_type:complete